MFINMRGVIKMSKHKTFVHIKGFITVCPVCHKPVHAGMSLRDSRWFWLHNDVNDYYNSPEHHNKSLVELSRNEVSNALRYAFMAQSDNKQLMSILKRV